MPNTTLTEYEYVQSLKIAAEGYDFYSLIAAAMRDADTENLVLLRTAFPGVWGSLLQWRDKPIWPAHVGIYIGEEPEGLEGAK